MPLNLELELWGNTLPADITQELINYAENELKVPPSYLITKLHYEGLWGGSEVARQNNNWGGMTWGGWTSPHTRDSGVIVTRGTPRPANEGGYYIKYETLDDFLVDWNYLIRRGGIYNVADSDTFQEAVKGMFRYGGAQYDYATMNIEGSEQRYRLYLQGMQARRTAINGANNGILTILDSDDYSNTDPEKEPPVIDPENPPIEDKPDEKPSGIDVLYLFNDLRKNIQDSLNADVVKTGEFYQNNHIRLIKQYDNTFKVQMNTPFKNAFQSIFNDFMDSYIPDEPEPDPEEPDDPDPDPEPDPEPDPDPPSDDMFFPVRNQNGVNFWKRANWGVGTLQRNMTYGARSNGGDHFGYDIGGGNNDPKPIYSVKSGIVKKAEYRNGIGNAVTIQQDDYFVEYGHLASYSVSVGDSVNAGEQIGTMGATGGNYAVHLDIKISTQVNGFYAYETTIDPEKYLKVTADKVTALPNP